MILYTSITQSGRQKLKKLEQMAAQIRKAEQMASVKSSRVLRKLLKLSSLTKKLTKKADIADFAKLYRCVHKESGKVVWISDDEDAHLRAKELGFLAPDLRAESDVSDVDADGGLPEYAVGDADSGAIVTETTAVSDIEGNVEELKAEVQALKHRLTSLDEGVAGSVAGVPVRIDKDGTPAAELDRNRPVTSNACTLL
jgi:hypothetical protein